MKMHRWLDFKVTRRCNNYSRKCAYCEVPVAPEQSGDALSLNDIHRVLTDAFCLGFDTFWLLGGEPTLRPDADRLFDPLADEEGVALTLVTNGKVRREDAYRALFSTKAHRACLQVSLDTLNPHNLKRADPARVIGLVTDVRRLARSMSTTSHTCDVEVHCVITRENLADFDDFGRHLAAQGVGVSLAMVCPWHVTDEPTSFREFTPREMHDVADRIERLRTGLAVDEFNPTVSAFVRRILGCVGGEPGRSCGAGLTHLVINGDGSVFRCMPESFRPEMAIGNVRLDRLHKILCRVDQPALCEERADCFDAFAWDRLALEAQEGGRHVRTEQRGHRGGSGPRSPSSDSVPAAVTTGDPFRLPCHPRG